jgi:hypothetical protein
MLRQRYLDISASFDRLADTLHGEIMERDRDR